MGLPVRISPARKQKSVSLFLRYVTLGGWCCSSPAAGSCCAPPALSLTVCPQPHVPAHGRQPLGPCRHPASTPDLWASAGRWLTCPEGSRWTRRCVHAGQVTAFLYPEDSHCAAGGPGRAGPERCPQVLGPASSSHKAGPGTGAGRSVTISLSLRDRRLLTATLRVPQAPRLGLSPTLDIAPSRLRLHGPTPLGGPGVRVRICPAPPPGSPFAPRGPEAGIPGTRAAPRAPAGAPSPGAPRASGCRGPCPGRRR